MRLHRFLTAAALMAGAPMLATTPASAFGTWNTPGYSVQLRLPAVTSPWPNVAQVPLFGGPRYAAELQPVYAARQTAELPADRVGHAPTFVAPGVEENAAGQIQQPQ